MADRIVRFTEAEIVRAIKGFQSTGLELGAIRFNSDGTMELITKGYETARSGDDWRDGSPLYAPKEEATDSDGRAYSVSRLAERWQCSDQLVRNMIKRGELRSFRYGNPIRIAAEAVDEVESRRTGRAAGEGRSSAKMPV